MKNRETRLFIFTAACAVVMAFLFVSILRAAG
jgi:hypothetical protein